MSNTSENELVGIITDDDLELIADALSFYANDGACPEAKLARLWKLVACIMKTLKRTPS